MVVYVILLTATILAYTRRIPVGIKRIPYYDTIGHFLLFGILALLLDRAMGGRNVKVFRGSVSLAALMVIGYAVIDEGLQGFSSVRTVDATDLLAGMCGVLCFVLFGRWSAWMSLGK